MSKLASKAEDSGVDATPRRRPLDGSRSAYLRPGTELLERLVEPYEILSVTLEDGVIRSN